MANNRIRTEDFVFQRVCLFLLRSGKSDDNFIIRAFFDEQIKCPFNCIESVDLHMEKEHQTFIYLAELKLMIDGEKKLYHQTDHGLEPLGPYHLRLSRKVSEFDKTYIDYEDEQLRFIANPFLNEYYFLFDADFQKKTIDSLPGHKTHFWCQFYIFTYYLLRYKMYNIFDILVEQFQDKIIQRPQFLTSLELVDFFQGCSLHMNYALALSVDNFIANKILLRMIGVLPIEKKNFDLRKRELKNFIAPVLDFVRDNYMAILETVSVEHWLLFRNGLVICLLFDLLTEQKDTIKLVHAIPDVDQKQNLATALLKKLEEFQKPILGLDWSSIFPLVDPNDLSLNSLELTQSMETYITSLISILHAKGYSEATVTEVSQHFDDLVRRERLPGIHLIPFSFQKKQTSSFF